MGSIVASVGSWLLSSLTTKTFLSNFIVQAGRRYAKKTGNVWDDEVLEFYAASLGIPLEQAKQLKENLGK